jgi:hypothetical protein
MLSIEYFLLLCSKYKEIKKRESKKRRGSVLLCIHSFWRVLHYIKKNLKSGRKLFLFCLSLHLPPSKSLLRSSSPAERRSSIYPAGLAAVFSQPGHFHIVNEWRWLRGLRTLHRIIRRATWWWGVHPLISSPLPLWQHHPAYHQRARETYIS